MFFDKHKKSQYLEVAIKSAKAAGKIIRANYGKHVDLHYKTGMDFVTEVDTKCEATIISIIKKSYPEHSIYGEESGIEKKNSEYMWIIDPLDGTTNFIMCNHFFNISIALAKNDEVMLGVVYNPITEELFYAEKGKGAFLNDEPIKVNTKDDIKKSILTFCHGSKDLHYVKRATAIYSKMKIQTSHVRQMGAAALELCYVACGRVSCFYMSDMNAYDVAAGSIIVSEATGKVTDFENKEFNVKSKDILASNGLIHEPVLKIINS